MEGHLQLAFAGADAGPVLSKADIQCAPTDDLHAANYFAFTAKAEVALQGVVNVAVSGDELERVDQQDARFAFGPTRRILKSAQVAPRGYGNEAMLDLPRLEFIGLRVCALIFFEFDGSESP